MKKYGWLSDDHMVRILDVLGMQHMPLNSRGTGGRLGFRRTTIAPLR